MRLTNWPIERNSFHCLQAGSVAIAAIFALAFLRLRQRRKQSFEKDSQTTQKRAESLAENSLISCTVPERSEFVGVPSLDQRTATSKSQRSRSWLLIRSYAWPPCTAWECVSMRAGSINTDRLIECAAFQLPPDKLRPFPNEHHLDSQ